MRNAGYKRVLGEYEGGEYEEKEVEEVDGPLEPGESSEDMGECLGECEE